MTSKSIPFAFLVFLAIFLLIIISVRYGIYVQKSSQVNEYLFKVQAQLSLTPSPTMKMQKYQKITDKSCLITYVLPTTTTVPTQIACAESTASSEGELRELGYQETSLDARQIFFKVDDVYRDLFLQTIATY